MNRLPSRASVGLPLALCFLLLLLSALVPPVVARAGEPTATRVEMLFFWAVGCPHCEEAKPFVARLEGPATQVSRWEVKEDPEGRRRFIEKVRALSIERPSVPTFVCGQHYVTGYAKGKTEPRVRAMLDTCRAEAQ